MAEIRRMVNFIEVTKWEKGAAASGPRSAAGRLLFPTVRESCASLVKTFKPRREQKCHNYRALEHGKMEGILDTDAYYFNFSSLLTSPFGSRVETCIEYIHFILFQILDCICLILFACVLHSFAGKAFSSSSIMLCAVDNQWSCGIGIARIQSPAWSLLPQRRVSVQIESYLSEDRA